MNFDLLWNCVAGGVYFCQFIISRTRYEEYASIEINPVDIAGVRLLRLSSEKPKTVRAFKQIVNRNPLSLNYSADESAGEFHIMRRYILKRNLE